MSGFKTAPKSEVRTIGVGMLGYGFMGKAHSNAFIKLRHIFWPPPAVPRLVAIAGRTEAPLADAAARYGFEGYALDWRELLADDRIELFDNCAWHDAHAEPCIAAAQAGKHVLCEKPLAVGAAEAKRMRDAAAAAGVKHMVAFNYRFAPAVRLARRLIQDGALGRIYAVRIRYLQEHGSFPERPYRAAPGKAGVILGLGTHVIDLSRFLVGEPLNVNGLVRTHVPQRASADDPRAMQNMPDEDAFVATVEFAGGAIGTLEAGYTYRGRKNQLAWEINGERGSLRWDLEDLNRLHVHLTDQSSPGMNGFDDVLVTESAHPLMAAWWPHGHILGWEHLHANLIHHFVRSIALDEPVDPDGATFEDGYRANVVAETIEESARTGRRLPVAYS